LIEFKDKQTASEIDKINPKLKKILQHMAEWIRAKGFRFVITDLLSEELEDKKLKRVSTSHLEGRAADIRVRDWPLPLREEFERYFENRYSREAAISKKSGKPNLIEIHDNGNGIHCHIQIRKGL